MNNDGTNFMTMDYIIRKKRKMLIKCLSFKKSKKEISLIELAALNRLLHNMIIWEKYVNKNN